MLNFSDLLPKDGEYAAWMQTVVEPFLEKYRKNGFFSSYDDAKLYCEYTLHPSPKAAIVLVHGFTESAEKYREMTYWFMQMGYSVFAFDQRGHGRSHRLSVDFAMTDVSSFSNYVRDLHCFIKKIVRPHAKGLPLDLYGHSMGGAVAVLYLENYPSVFRRAILNAPMLKPKTANYPTFVSRSLSAVLRVIGQGEKRVFTYREGFDPYAAFEDSPDTSKERFLYYHQKRIDNPYLQNTYPSYRWLNESLRIVPVMLDPDRCARVHIPVLLFSAGDDTFVHRREQEIFISLIEKGEIVYEEQARHEIYMSTNDVMASYLYSIAHFLQSEG